MKWCFLLDAHFEFRMHAHQVIIEIFINWSVQCSVKWFFSSHSAVHRRSAYEAQMWNLLGGRWFSLNNVPFACTDTKNRFVFIPLSLIVNVQYVVIPPKSSHQSHIRVYHQPWRQRTWAVSTIPSAYCAGSTKSLARTYSANLVTVACHHSTWS